ncbi:MAG TPA: hypothetical protein VGB22_07780 [candidate division Zixibacteria bacterium]|jgi:hypothetical protein
MAYGLLAQVLMTFQRLIESAGEHWQSVNAWALATFGPWGQWALWGCLGLLLLYCASKAARLALDVTRYVLLPSVGLTVAVIMLLPGWDPSKTFTALVAATGAVALIRSR